MMSNSITTIQMNPEIHHCGDSVPQQTLERRLQSQATRMGGRLRKVFTVKTLAKPLVGLALGALLLTGPIGQAFADSPASSTYDGLFENAITHARDLEVFYRLQYGGLANASPKLNRAGAASSGSDGVLENAVTHARDLEVFYQLRYGDSANASPKLSRVGAANSSLDGVFENALTHARDLEVFYRLQYGDGS